ncbi:hypothetical protein [Prescottella agglutinans]|uniref:Uncharacterized protein n=1 Tax=Prescottella agglutinans TaxID=1644129 RepID=A0ABT6M9J8_9NOCA|nr:hypothetical protein [Prescottella agglutinans]MDH6280988.1 hypothetical protein [Prescottella agglutinans]
MATTEIAPAELNSSHVGQYLKVSLIREAYGADRETLVTGVIVKVEHESLLPVDPATVTTVTLDVAGTPVPIVMPAEGLAEIADDINAIHPLPA